MSRTSLIGLSRRFCSSFLLNNKPSILRTITINSAYNHTTHPSTFSTDTNTHHHPQFLPFGMTPQLHNLHHRPTIRPFSSESSKPDPNPNNHNPNPNPEIGEMKHQEIEGPTVEKDISPLANETREVTQSLLKNMYNVSRLLALLGLAHLVIGTYCSYATTFIDTDSATPKSASASLSIVSSALAFGFPFSMAFMLRQSLKSMHFFQKMEQIGRLQLLTSSMQIFKQLRLFFVRLTALSYLGLAALSFSFIYSLFRFV